MDMMLVVPHQNGSTVSSGFVGNARMLNGTCNHHRSVGRAKSAPYSVCFRLGPFHMRRTEGGCTFVASGQRHTCYLNFAARPGALPDRRAGTYCSLEGLVMQSRSPREVCRDRERPM